jgi:hypothetical protein
MSIFRKFKKEISFLLLVAFIALPQLALADGFTVIQLNQLKSFNLDIVKLIEAILNILWPITVAVVIAMFMWAGVQFLLAQGDPAKIAVARQSLIWGFVGIIVIILAISIVAALQKLFS